MTLVSGAIPRDGRLPAGWAVATLDELGAWTGGGTPKKSVDSYWDGRVPWISPKDMKSIRLTDTQDHITEAAVDESAAKKFPANSIAVVVRSGILERTLPIALVPFRATANQDMKILTPSPWVNPAWLLHALLAAAPDIRERCRKHGTTVASIDFPKLRSYPLAVPPRAEQDRIVAAVERHLEVIEDARSEVRGARNQLASLRSVVLANAVPPARTVLLEDIADVRSGLTKGRKLKAPTQSYPFLRAANLRDGYLDLDEIKEIPATTDEAGRFSLQTGDVLLVEGSGSAARLGQGWLWEGQVETCLHQNHVFRARPDQDLVLPRFLAWILQTPGVKAYFHSQTKTTSGLTTINRRQVCGTPIPLAPLDEQRRVVETIERRIGASELLQTSLDAAEVRADALVRAVLVRASNGELVNQDPSDEPAAEFLARAQVEKTHHGDKKRARAPKAARTSAKDVQPASGR